MSESFIARDYMATHLVTFSPEMDIYEAAAVLLENRISGAPVVDSHGKLLGLLSEQDCLREILAKGMHDMPPGKVADYMSTDIVTINPDMSIFKIAEMFVQHRFRRFPVVEHGRLVGQISKRDLLAAIKDMRKGWEKGKND